MVKGVPVPQSVELREELARYEWMPQAWADQSEQSRLAYDDWVQQSRSPRIAKRRAQAVSRRCYIGRPWAPKATRALQAGKDFFATPPEGPTGIDPIGG